MLADLLELRQRLIYILIVFSIGFVVCLCAHQTLYHYLLTPALKNLPPHAHLITTDVMAPFTVPVSLAANAALLLTTPFIFWQVGSFLRPGLYAKERRYLKPFFIYSTFLFILGGCFCFYLILPPLFDSLSAVLPASVDFMPDMAKTLSFILKMLFLFGLSFQVPLITVMLVQFNWVDLDTFKRIRPYVIVGAFVIGMLVMSPDLLSQILFAVPLCLLYEFGIFISSRIKKR